jgi:uncharacterized protein YijF (DUF1287 family)
MRKGLHGAMSIRNDPRMNRRNFLPAALLLSAPLSFAERPAEIAKFLAAAQAQIGKTLTYDPAYTSLEYPGGDVPIERGVCSDVAIRAFRGVGFDLQKEIHQDMKRAFSLYPKNWGLRKPDANIDHRRVLNLMTFFKRRGKSVPVTQNPADYQPGDLVTCIVPKNLPHIMIVSDQVSPLDPARRLIIHNIGNGARAEDRLFDFELTGHFRWW